MASLREIRDRVHATGHVWYTSVKGRLNAIRAAMTRRNDVFLGGGLVGHAATEQLSHGARHTRRARVAARQPARLLIVRLQPQPQQQVTGAMPQHRTPPQPLQLHRSDYD